MKLSDLLGADVVDAAGRAVGRVHDVRVVQDGPIVFPFGAALRVEGLVVGKGWLGERLGFHRSTVHGPWMLKAFFEWRHRGALFVPWEAVTEVGAGAIRIDRGAEKLAEVEKL